MQKMMQTIHSTDSDGNLIENDLTVEIFEDGETIISVNDYCILSFRIHKGITIYKHSGVDQKYTNVLDECRPKVFNSYGELYRPEREE